MYEARSETDYGQKSHKSIRLIFAIWTRNFPSFLCREFTFLKSFSSVDNFESAHVAVFGSTTPPKIQESNGNF